MISAEIRYTDDEGRQFRLAARYNDQDDFWEWRLRGPRPSDEQGRGGGYGSIEHGETPNIWTEAQRLFDQAHLDKLTR